MVVVIDAGWHSRKMVSVAAISFDEGGLKMMLQTV